MSPPPTQLRPHAKRYAVLPLTFAGLQKNSTRGSLSSGSPTKKLDMAINSEAQRFSQWAFLKMGVLAGGVGAGAGVLFFFHRPRPA